MSFSEIEKKIVRPFYRYANMSRENIKDTYLLKWKYGTQVLAKYDTDYESDNELEFDDPSYEEFVGIAIYVKKVITLNPNDNLFPDHTINCNNIREWLRNEHLYEINYHNFPDEIYNSKGELISKKDS